MRIRDVSSVPHAPGSPRSGWVSTDANAPLDFRGPDATVIAEGRRNHPARIQGTTRATPMQHQPSREIRTTVEDSGADTKEKSESHAAWVQTVDVTVIEYRWTRAARCGAAAGSPRIARVSVWDNAFSRVQFGDDYDGASRAAPGSRPGKSRHTWRVPEQA